MVILKYLSIIDAVVTHLPPTSEVGDSNLRPYVGKLEVAY